MIEKKKLQKIMKPIVDDSDAMVMAWHSPDSDTSQIVLNGHPIDMLLLIAKAMHRIEETLEFPVEAQIEAMKKVFWQMKKDGVYSATMQAGEKIDGRFN